MDFGALYDFLFNTYAGIGCLVGIGLVVSLIACVIMERRTRKTFVDRQGDEDDWSFFDDEDDEEEDDGPDDAGELDELEHMRDVADMAYAALSDLALHCHNRREDVAWGIASSAAKDAHVLATFVGDWIEDMEDED